VVVGHVGSRSQLDYRALGDAINTAKRLEDANRQLGTRVCVAAGTVSRVPGFVGRPIGALELADLHLRRLEAGAHGTVVGLAAIRDDAVHVV
jgi:class 3 adenylate cyclase